MLRSIPSTRVFCISRPDVSPRVLGNEIYRYTRIPVTVGVGETKTLGKAANHIAKRHPVFDGALTLPGESGQ